MLNQQDLAAALEKMHGDGKFPKSPVDAARLLAKAYAGYCKSASDAVSGKLMHAPGEAAMMGFLAAQWAPGQVTAQQAAGIIAKAMQLFWQSCALFMPGTRLLPSPAGAPIQVISSTIMPPMVAATAEPLLLQHFISMAKNAKATPASVYRAMAGHMHAATMTVQTLIVEMVQPPGTVPPVPVPFPPLPIS